MNTHRWWVWINRSLRRDTAARPLWRRYLMAAGALGLALLVRAALTPLLGDRVPFLLLVPMAMIVTWYGGFWVGGTAVVAGVAAGMMEFLPAQKLQSLSPAGSTVFLAIYILVLALVVALTGLAQRQWRAQHAADRRSLAQSEERFGLVVEMHPDGVLVFSGGKVVFANPAALQCLGAATPAQLLGRSALDLTHLEFRGLVAERLRQTLATGQRNPRLENKLLRLDGTSLDVETTSARIAWKGQPAVSVVLHGLAKRKARLRERQDTIDFMTLLNAGNHVQELIPAVTAFFQQHSNCAAVAVRWRQGQDYPYVHTRGFSPEFVARERSLCTPCGPAEGMAGSAAGEPLLACLCGAVITAQAEPAIQALLTPRGTLWTNDIASLLATLPAGCRTSLRGTCPAFGYRSMALIPLSIGGQRLGLLQLNDPQPDRFTPESIARWECLAEHFAVSLAKLMAEEALHASENRLRRFYESNLMGVIYWNTSGQITDANDKFLDMVGYDRADLAAGRIDWRCMTPPEYRQVTANSLAQIIATGVTTTPFEKEYLRKDGTRLPILTAGAMFDDARGAGVAFILDISERKRAEAALRQSEETHRVFFELAPIGMVYATPDGRIAKVNDKFCEIIGYTHQELTGMEVLDLTHPDDRGVTSVQFAAYLRGERQTYSEEKRYLRKDGTVRWVSVTARLAYQTEGHPQYSLGVVEDITARKAAEAALQESEIRFRSLFQNAMDAMFLTIPEGTIVAANPAACAMFGMSEAELCRVGRAGIINSADPNYATAQAERARTGRVSAELTFIRKDGTIFSGELQSVLLGPEQNQAFVVIHDITERKAAQDAIQASEQRYRALFEQNPDGVFAVDTTGRFILANPACATITGYSLDELLGKTFMELCAPDALESMVQEFQLNLTGQYTANQVTTILHKDGHRVDLLLTGGPVMVNGQVTAIHIAAKDIAQIRQAQDVLKKAQAELETRVAERTAELRQANAELRAQIARRQQAEEQTRQLEKEILDVAGTEQRRIGQELHDNLGQVVTGTAMMARSLYQKFPDKTAPMAVLAAELAHQLKVAQTQLRNLARGLVAVEVDPEGLMDALQTLANDTSVLYGVACTFACDQPVLMRDTVMATQLFRIAQESITNVVKHSHARRVVITLAVVAGQIELMVRDDGIGIKTAGPAHTGLGLRIMHYRAELLGAALTILAVPDGGTLVRCVLKQEVPVP